VIVILGDVCIPVLSEALATFEADANCVLVAAEPAASATQLAEALARCDERVSIVSASERHEAKAALDQASAASVAAVLCLPLIPLPVARPLPAPAWLPVAALRPRQSYECEQIAATAGVGVACHIRQRGVTPRRPCDGFTGTLGVVSTAGLVRDLLFRAGVIAKYGD